MKRAAWVVVAGVVAIAMAGCTAASDPLTLATPQPGVEYTTTLTVIDDGGGANGCPLVLESYPPQCGGALPLANFDWNELDGFEADGGVRWGFYELVGTYDGTTLSLTEVPRPGTTGPTPPVHSGTLSENEMTSILDDIREELPDVLGSGQGDGYVTVSVRFDDGSLQRQVDARYGAGNVIVDSLLRGVGE